MGNALTTKQHQVHVHEQEAIELPEIETQPHENSTCEICIEPFHPPTNNFKNGNHCSHPYCMDCMIRYIQTNLDDNVSDIPCPAPDCPHMFDPLFFRPLITPQLFTKWCDLLCDSTVLGLDRCYCPNMECSALVVNECGGRVKKEKCPNCKRLFCFMCKQPWHAGFRCGEIRDQNDEAFGVLAEERQWRRCPRCFRFVERRAGCRMI